MNYIVSIRLKYQAMILNSFFFASIGILILFMIFVAVSNLNLRNTKSVIFGPTDWEQQFGIFQKA